MAIARVWLELNWYSGCGGLRNADLGLPNMSHGIPVFFLVSVALMVGIASASAVYNSTYEFRKLYLPGFCMEIRWKKYCIVCLQMWFTVFCTFTWFHMLCVSVSSTLSLAVALTAWTDFCLGFLWTQSLLLGFSLGFGEWGIGFVCLWNYFLWS